MKPNTIIGVLAFHGDVTEHIEATKQAIKNLSFPFTVLPIRTKKELETIHALIIPGGESTTLISLCQREDMINRMKKIPAIFGTCAGAILLAKTICHQAPGQQTLALMNIEVDRNAYGRQSESFEQTIQTSLGVIDTVFIRAPKIKKVGTGVCILADYHGEILACEEQDKGRYYLAATFHPELTSTLFHEYFLRKVSS